MSSTTTESPIIKVIFLQKIFRFAGRTVKDLVIINSVCKDFEETMQAHHTFNLVLYDNISKTQNNFLGRSVVFLSTAPAWIVYQWTVVNEHDETQRELLKAFLLFQAQNDENKILIRKNVSKADPSTTRELLCHILDSCVKLGIVTEMFGASRYARNCIMQAVSRQIPADSLALLIASCIQHSLDMKKMLEENDRLGYNFIMLAVGNQLPFDSLKLLIESCVKFSVDMKKTLEHRSGIGRNSIMIGASSHLPLASFKLLIESCVQHGLEMKNMLEHQDNDKWTCLSLASFSQLNSDSFKLLTAYFPSNESFRATLAAENWHRKCAVDHATQKIKALLEDPNCWKKCREWCTSNGITI